MYYSPDLEEISSACKLNAGTGEREGGPRIQLKNGCGVLGLHPWARRRRCWEWRERGTFLSGPPRHNGADSGGYLKVLVLLESHAFNLSIIASASFEISLINVCLNHK